MSPHIWLFKSWQFLPYIPIVGILGLFVIGFVAVVFVFPLCQLFCYAICCFCPSKVTNRYPNICSSYCSSDSSFWKQIESYRLKLIQEAGRYLCPWIFPDLFTMHKMRSQTQNSRESSPEVFLVLLNRKVENNPVILSSFAFMSVMVLTASAMAFLTSVPRVTYDTQCIEKNSNNHPLYCYDRGSDYPDNCTSLTSQERAKAEYTCYACTLDVFSIACVAAVTVFKLAVAITTYYVQFGEMWLKACKGRKCINGVCKSMIWLLLGACGGGSVAIAVYRLLGSLIREIRGPVQFFSFLNEYAGYVYLPMWLCIGLILITWKLEAHCMQQEYSTLSESQIPPPDQLSVAIQTD